MSIYKLYSEFSNFIELWFIFYLIVHLIYPFWWFWLNHKSHCLSLFLLSLPCLLQLYASMYMFRIFLRIVLSLWFSAPFVTPRISATSFCFMSSKYIDLMMNCSWRLNFDTRQTLPLPLPWRSHRIFHQSLHNIFLRICMDAVRTSSFPPEFEILFSVSNPGAEVHVIYWCIWSCLIPFPITRS